MSQKLPSLDGWRAVSIWFVLLGHSAHVPGFPAAIAPALDLFRISSVGVQFFFVISGFLITWLLLQEKEQQGEISLKHFYIRRILRIFPVCYVYLLVLGLFTHCTQTVWGWLANITFTTNFYLGGAEPTGHLWSLAVEEQFYILWPGLLVYAMKRAHRPDALLKVLLVPLVVAPIVRLIDSKNYFPQSLHFLVQGASFFAKFDTLAFGCIAAILVFSHRQKVVSWYLSHPNLASWGGVALILIPLPLGLLHFPGRLQAALFISMQSLGFVVLMIQSVMQPQLCRFRWLNWRWVAHLGVLSYSTYIWQQMFYGTDESIFGVKGAWWVTFPVWIFIALFAAHLSYYLLERPLFKLRARFRA